MQLSKNEKKQVFAKIEVYKMRNRRLMQRKEKSELLPKEEPISYKQTIYDNYIMLKIINCLIKNHIIKSKHGHKHNDMIRMYLTFAKLPYPRPKFRLKEYIAKLYLEGKCVYLNDITLKEKLLKNAKLNRIHEFN
jgi:hypothetical protein